MNETNKIKEFNWVDCRENELLLTKEQREYFKEVFESGLPYRIVRDSEGLRWLITGEMKLPLWRMANYYKVTNGAKEYPTKQQARFYRGIPLEKLLQTSLIKNNIPFKGNPLNPAHYPRTHGLHVDVETEHMLIEATNPKRTTWLDNDAMNEKIEYFAKADPEHKKQWILLASYRRWNKIITQRLSQLNITIIELGKAIHNRNWKLFKIELSKILHKVNQRLTNQHPINTLNNTLTNNKNKITTIKNRIKNRITIYLNRCNSSINPVSEVDLACIPSNYYCNG